MLWLTTWNNFINIPKEKSPKEEGLYLVCNFFLTVLPHQSIFTFPFNVPCMKCNYSYKRLSKEITIGFFVELHLVRFSWLADLTVTYKWFKIITQQTNFSHRNIPTASFHELAQISTHSWISPFHKISN